MPAAKCALTSVQIGTLYIQAHSIRAQQGLEPLERTGIYEERFALTHLANIAPSRTQLTFATKPRSNKSLIYWSWRQTRSVLRVSIGLLAERAQLLIPDFHFILLEYSLCLLGKYKGKLELPSLSGFGKFGCADRHGNRA